MGGKTSEKQWVVSPFARPKSEKQQAAANWLSLACKQFPVNFDAGGKETKNIHWGDK